MPRSRNEELNVANIQAIKDTARQLMAEHGTDGLSVRGIAKVLGITPPAIYHYFASLDELITALITDNFNALADALEAARAT
ncbi:MAG: helix-turn-helix transcriptional regulator, partial [Anaerolineae bacterium]|nr:helix-turn-helix transcriptional regulator [Anaerolineae bacterium]